MSMATPRSPSPRLIAFHAPQTKQSLANGANLPDSLTSLAGIRMEWLVLLGLGAWVWLQSRRIETLSLKLAELERRLGLGDFALPEPGETPAPVPPTVPQEPALLLTEVVVEDELLSKHREELLAMENSGLIFMIDNDRMDGWLAS